MNKKYEERKRTDGYINTNANYMLYINFSS